MNKKLLRDTYIEIDLDSIAYNVKQIRKYIGDNVAIAAVVKANGYGHGATEIASTIINNGADMLAVATLTEALELRKKHKTYEILIMGYTSNPYLEINVKYNLITTIFSIEQANILNNLGKKLNIKPRVHIKYDTGFNRLGFADSIESINEISLICNLENINVEGIFSHFALKNSKEDKIQYNKLVSAINKIEKETKPFKYKHICDSIGAILYPEFHLSMIRPGAIIYGLQSEEKDLINLKQAMKFKTKISFIKKINEGDGISYGYRWIAKRDSIIGTIPLGYADGYPRNMYQKGYVTVNGKKAPIVGIICMDQCMIDLTDIENVNVNDIVTIFDDGSNNALSIAETASLAETNKNEIVSRITRRTPRIYLKNKKIIEIINYLLGGEYSEY